MQKAAKAYFATQVQTTSQGKLLLMLYDGCIKFLNQAKDKIAERDYAQKGILISRALDIINELDSSLNVEKGGDLAENLHKLYFFCSTRLLNANLKMDVSLIDEVISVLDGLRSAYAQIIDTPEAVAAMKQNTTAQQASSFGTARPIQAPPQPNTMPQGPKPKAGMYGSFGNFGKPANGFTAAANTQETTQPPSGQTSKPEATSQPSGTAEQTAPANASQPTHNNEATASKSQQENNAPEKKQAETQEQPAQQGQFQQPAQFNFGGKRLTGAAMYQKMASN